MRLKFKCPKCNELYGVEVDENEVKNATNTGIRFKKVVKCSKGHSYLLYIAMGPKGVYIRDYEEVIADDEKKKSVEDFADEIFG